MEPVKRRPGRPKGSVNKVDPNKPKRTRAKATVRKTQNAAAPAAYGEAGLDGVDGPYYRKRVLEDDEDSWENESLFEDVIDDLAEGKDLTEVPGACLPHEAAMYRQMLRDIGPKEFCRQTVEAGTITAKKLLTAFGVRPPAFLEGGDDSSYFGLLALVMSRELKKRVKLPFYNTVDDAAELIKKSRNIMVLTGAGISTSLGIPDFRSAHTGLYSQLAQRGLEINDPQEVFDINRFQEDPSIFFSVAKDILPSTTRFSPTHAFIAMLQERDKLLTNYTQNIDNIEANAGIRPDKLVQCHGSFATATCQDCGYQVPGSTIFADIKADIIPRCLRCVETLRTSGKTKRKRAYKAKSAARKSRFSDDDDDGQYDLPEAGIMKPDITFFGEALPDRFNERLEDHDHDKVDLVIVIGTSLKVAPVSEVVPFLPSHIPQIYISREPVSHIEFDIDLLGDCDTVVAELCNRMGWPLFHQMVRPDQKIEVQQDANLPSRHYFTAADAPIPSLSATPLASPLPSSISPLAASGGASPVPLPADEAGVAGVAPVRKPRRLPRTASTESR